MGLVALLAACAPLPVPPETVPARPEATPARPETTLAWPEATPARPETTLAQPEATPAPPETTPAAKNAAAEVPLLAAQNGAAEAPPAEAGQPAKPPPPANLWQRIRTGFRLPDRNGPLVQEGEQWYSSRPDYVARMVERGSRFLYYVVEEVERRGMPAEIALLPMIESAYNPRAYSRSNASGIWQFIPSTGKLYGLRQNFWYDARRDVLAATNAALDYLEKLYGMFGNWELALASYNWGEGAVSRAIARNQAKGLPTDYESLALPPETRAYVPKLQAVKNIVADPARFGLQLADIPNEPYFATVTLKRPIDVQLAAKLAEMPLEEFKYLNPENNKPVIKSDGSKALVLPRDRVEIFQRNLEANDRPLVSWQVYTVKRHDQPEKIAAKYGMTLARLKEINGIAGGKKINPGQALLVPVRGNAEPYLPDLPAPKVATARYQPKKKYTQAVRKVGPKKLVQRSAATRKPAAGQRPPAKRVQATIRSRPGGKTIALAEEPKDAH